MGPAPVVSISSNAAPRSPFAFVGRAGRAARALTTAVSALALAAGALILAPTPTHAADPITTQEYFSYYHLDAARQKGYTGKGVTIALIDGPVDTSAPELAGANITDKSRCTIEASPAEARHGTDMATLPSTPTRPPPPMLYRQARASPTDYVSIPWLSSSIRPSMTVPRLSPSRKALQKAIRNFSGLSPAR